MGVGDSKALLRDGTVALTAAEIGAPATAGTFVYDTLASGAVPASGLTFQPAATGGGTAILNPMIAAMIVPAASTTLNAKIQLSDDNTNWEDVAVFGSETFAGAVVSAAVASNNCNTAGEYRVRFAARRRFIRHNVTAVTGTPGAVVIRLELAD